MAVMEMKKFIRDIITTLYIWECFDREYMQDLGRCDGDEWDMEIVAENWSNLCYEEDAIQRGHSKLMANILFRFWRWVKGW
tara:strand:- start:30 stop:272 length:243 start_codon:yes stop_codon:yes gene_type:complete